MKHSVELSEAEIAKAIKEYMNAREHKYAYFSVRFNVSSVTDPFDRPIGRYVVSAVVTREEQRSDE